MGIWTERSRSSFAHGRRGGRAGTFGAVVIAGVLGLSACGSSTDDAGAPGSDAAPNTFSPLDEYLKGAFGPAPDDAKDRQVQDKVAACMKAAGFEYVPNVQNAPAEGAGPKQGDRAWTEKFGYGITTSAFTSELRPEDDPNAKITEGMSDSEQAAYYKALYGNGGGMSTTTGSVGGGGVVALAPAGPIPAAGAETPDDPTTGAAEPPTPGCYTTARTAVYGETPQVDFSQLDDLFKQLEKVQKAVDTDPRVAPKVTAWTNCMADAGHPGFTAIADAQESIMKKWADLNGWDYQPGSSTGGFGFSVRAGSAVSMSVGGQSADAPEQAKVDELKKTEIDLAVQDLNCRGDYQAVHDQVRIELEQKFTDEHKAELDQYRNSVTGG